VRLVNRHNAEVHWDATSSSLWFKYTDAQGVDTRCGSKTPTA
jgi:spore germination protein YaaH